MFPYFSQELFKAKLSKIWGEEEEGGLKLVEKIRKKKQSIGFQNIQEKWERNRSSM